jgi:predicted kinase
VLVTADEGSTRQRLARRQVDRAANDHSDADLRVYERMRERGFDPPETGHLEIRNGPDLASEIERVAQAIE